MTMYKMFLDIFILNIEKTKTIGGFSNTSSPSKILKSLSGVSRFLFGGI